VDDVRDRGLEVEGQEEGEMRRRMMMAMREKREHLDAIRRRKEEIHELLRL
jgi:hypothetical protein